MTLLHVFKVGKKDLLHGIQFGKCSHADDTIGRGLMMRMSSAMGGNKQQRKQLIVVRHKTLKWIKVNSAPPKGSLCRVPMVDGMTMTSFSQLQ
jgi:hypothetical protein